MTAHAPDQPADRAGTRLGALQVLEAVLDEGSFTSWDTPPEQPDLGQEYADLLARAQERSGADEAVLTGEGRLDGRRVAVVAGEFAFLAGSVGSAASERITRAYLAAADALRLLHPMLTVTAATDDAVLLSPPVRLTLEQALAYIGDDELVEVTPRSIRLRKRQLAANERRKEAKRGAAA